LDRAPRAGRRELDDPEAVIEGEVGVEPPPEVPVELLRAVDIRDGMTTTSSFTSILATLASLVASFLKTSFVLMAAPWVVYYLCRETHWALRSASPALEASLTPPPR
jgi:hypothetical protein